MKYLKPIKNLFSVYNEWTGTHRISREMVVSALMIFSSIWSWFADYELFQGNELAVMATGIFGAIGLVLRVTSKGGESIVKPKVRERKEINDEAKAYEKSLMPELPGE